MLTHHMTTSSHTPDAPPPVSMVVFDLGGVVVRICRSWSQACAAAGVPDRDPEGTLMAPQATDRRLLVRAYETGSIDCEAFFAGIARTTRDLYTVDEFRRIHDAWILDEYPGVATLSNTNHRHWLQLTTGPHGPAKFPTPQKVRHLHASHLLQLAKPDSAIYHAFARTVGLSDTPAELLFFDDLIDNVAAARSAGWQSVQINHAGEGDQSPAHQMRAELTRRRVLA
jgi:HAD superfamily hydrolase (TIGR01509 family)